MICQNVNPGRKVQWKYVGHAELCNIILNWGYPCLISVKNKYQKYKFRQSFERSTFCLFHH